MKKIKVFGLLLCLSTLLSGCTNVIDEFYLTSGLFQYLLLI